MPTRCRYYCLQDVGMSSVSVKKVVRLFGASLNQVSMAALTDAKVALSTKWKHLAQTMSAVLLGFPKFLQHQA